MDDMQRKGRKAGQLALAAGRQAKGALSLAGGLAAGLAGRALAAAGRAALRGMRSAMVEALKRSFGPLWAKGVVDSLGIHGLDFEGSLRFPAPAGMAFAQTGGEQEALAAQMLMDILREPFAQGGHELRSARMEADGSAGEVGLALSLRWIGVPAALLEDGAKAAKAARLRGEDVHAQEAQDIEFKERPEGAPPKP